MEGGSHGILLFITIIIIMTCSNQLESIIFLSACEINMRNAKILCQLINLNIGWIISYQNWAVYK